MKTICCECKKVMHPGPCDEISHGICLDCIPDFLKRGGVSETKIKKLVEELRENENEDK